MIPDRRLALVVAAAGHGTRLNPELPKQYMPLLGIPMLQRTLSTLAACDRVDALVITVNPLDVEFCEQEILLEHIGKVVQVTGGDEKRWMSVRNGLRALAEKGSWDFVGVHDGARPLVTCQEIGRAVDALAADESLDGVVLAVPSIDTVKIVDEAGVIKCTPDRNTLWRAQTPQIFRWQVLMDAYAQPDEVLMSATDDASLVEAGQGRVAVVEGSTENLKITDWVDLQLAEQILAGRRR